jgi:hypothetical protein
LSAKVRPPWAWPMLAALIVAVSLAPLFVVDVPAVLDFPNHLARFYILAHPDDPVLSKMYAPHWRILPNVGMDVIGQALLRVLPVYVGGRVLLGLSLLAPLVGTALYARAAFERWTWWSLGSGVIAYNGIVFLGFMNFLLGLGIGLAGAALWRVLRRKDRYVAAAATGAVVGLAAFFCHLLGFAFFALLIGAQEAEAVWRVRREGELTAGRALRAVAALAVALGPAVALYLATHRSIASGDVMVWLWRPKLVHWLAPAMIYDMRLTILTALTLAVVIILGWRKAGRAVGATLALGSLVALYLVAPFAVAGGTFFDSRLPLMAALLLFAGLAPRPSFRTGLAIAAAFGLLIAGRATLVAVNWIGRAHDLADLRAGLAVVAPGARILPAQTEFLDSQVGASGRLLPNFSRMDEHLAGVALIERRAFWPLLFADPSQQPVIVRPPYDRIAQPLGQVADWRDLADNPPTPAEIARHPYLAGWRTNFDYVLLTGPRPASTPAGLTLVHAGEAVSVYRVNR